MKVFLAILALIALFFVAVLVPAKAIWEITRLLLMLAGVLLALSLAIWIPWKIAQALWRGFFAWREAVRNSRGGHIRREIRDLNTDLRHIPWMPIDDEEAEAASEEARAAFLRRMKEGFWQ